MLIFVSITKKMEKCILEVRELLFRLKCGTYLKLLNKILMRQSKMKEIHSQLKKERNIDIICYFNIIIIAIILVVVPRLLILLISFLLILSLVEFFLILRTFSYIFILLSCISFHFSTLLTLLFSILFFVFSFFKLLQPIYVPLQSFIWQLLSALL